MTTYIYKGNWDSGISYKIDSAVMFSGDYYKALVVTMPGQSPSTDPSKWELLPSYAYPSEEYLSLTYDDIVEDHVNPYEIGDNLGLYQFPSKEAINKGSVALNELHFHKLGVEMMYEYAKAYYVDNEAYMPKITGIYIVQGERKKNVVTQGFSIAAVEAVGFSINEAGTKLGVPDDSRMINITQTSKLGNNENDIAFPIFGGSDYRMFPVIKMTRGRWSGNAYWRMEEDSISELLVMPKSELITYNQSLSESIGFANPLGYHIIEPARWTVGQKSFINNITTNKFCVFTPDILLDKSIVINNNLYIKPVKKIDYNIEDYLSITHNSTNLDTENKISSFAHMGKHYESNNYSLYQHLAPSSGFKTRNSVFQPIMNKYVSIASGMSLYMVNASVIQENQIYSDYGFSTRMKSIIDIFGFDYKTKVASQSSTITAFLNASRQQLYDAGVMLNRTKWSVLDNEIEQPAILNDGTGYDPGYHTTYPFGFDGRLVAQFYGSESSQLKSLFVVATNLSMRSLPYIGIVRNSAGKYSSAANIDAPYNHLSDNGYDEIYTDGDYRNLHNAIVNLCLYKNNDDYKTAVYNSFDLLSEQYKVIGYNKDILVNQNIIVDSKINESSNLYGFAARYVLVEQGVVYTFSANGRCNNVSPGKKLSVFIHTGNWTYAHHIDITSTNDTTSSVTFTALESGILFITAYYYDASAGRDGTVTVNWYKLEKGNEFTGYIERQNLYRGDVFSQKTFMRCIKWDSLPDIMTTLAEEEESASDWSYSWKFGQAINIYLQSFVNTYLRIPEHDSMYYPYVKTFFSSNQEAIDNFVWKNTSMRYLKETWKTNDGYNITHGLWAFYAYDELLMKRSYLAANRIYASNVHAGGAIVDQYRSIPSGQFMDYNFEGGDIVKLVKFNNTMFTIQKYAIIQHYQSRELKTAEDSSTIITGDKSVLNDFYRHLENYGTSHKESIVNGTMGIYGVDWDKEKIWRIKQEYGSEGGVYFLCENLVESKTIYDIFKIIKKDNNPLVQNLYGDNMTGIVSTYDEENKQILFTFHLGLNNDTVPKHIYYTLAFSEEMDAFIGFLSYNSNYYIKFDNRLLSFSWGQEKTSRDLWEHNTGDYLKLYGTKQDMELTFIVNGVSEQQNAGNFEKEFQSHLINSSHDVFDIVSWETEWQSSEKNPFINDNEFWSNPEYKEHTWRVPIITNTKINNSGPLGTNNFSTFETNSSMRGQWIKVTLKYKPKSDVDLQFYIKNVITNFLISYS